MGLFKIKKKHVFGDFALKMRYAVFASPSIGILNLQKLGILCQQAWGFDFS